MKKLILSISIILSLLTLSLPATAKINWQDIWPKTTTNLTWIQTGTFFIYCGYQVSRVDNGQVISDFVTPLPKLIFKSCPTL